MTRRAFLTASAALVAAPVMPNWIASSFGAQASLWSATQELSVNVPFFDREGVAMPKVPIYAVPLYSLVAGEILDVSAEFVLDARTSGAHFPIFAACCVALQPESPATEFVQLPPASKFICPQSGYDIDVNKSIPYQQRTRVGRYVVQPDDEGTRAVVVISWVSSLAAGRWDVVNIQPGYGRLDVVRFGAS